MFYIKNEDGKYVGSILGYGRDGPDIEFVSDFSEALTFEDQPAAYACYILLMSICIKHEFIVFYTEVI